ncbi:hypothetical protein KI387_001967, partial [Taxus chinensis]
ARLEVMGRKVKNAVFISGSNAVKIANEVAKVEKRRVVKSTVCNERSSRSHCLITLDVPAVGGRMMLVDMAGSENIDQAGFAGFEAKLQTGKINQGNIALKRVVEAIANGDPHVPFRDSRLTMLLQDSFEDNGTKILMVLCASPDPRDIHKTIGTLEYGAKAKCIVRCFSSPSKQKPSSQDNDSTVLGARIAAMDEYISKLQIDNNLKEKEREAAQKELLKKEEEVGKLRAKLQELQKIQSEKQEQIDLKVEEKAKLLKLELLRIFEECWKSANVFVELGKRKMEQEIIQQQEEVKMLRQRLEEIESEFEHIKSTPPSNNHVRMDASIEIERISDIGVAGELVSSSARVLQGMQACIQKTEDKFRSPQDRVQKFPYRTFFDLEGHDEVISSDNTIIYGLDFCAKSNSNEPDDLRDTPKSESKGGFGGHVIVDELESLSDNVNTSFYSLNKDERLPIHQQFPFLNSHGSGHNGDGVEEDHTESTRFVKMGWLSTIYEEGGDIGDLNSAKVANSSKENCIMSDFTKTQIADGCGKEGKILGHFVPKLKHVSCLQNSIKLSLVKQADKNKEAEKGRSENWAGIDKPVANYNCVLENQIDLTISRKARIQNIFSLCGNHRELAQQARSTPPNNGGRSHPVDIPHNETPKESVVGSNWSSTTSFEEPVHSLSPEVAGVVTPSRQSSSPGDVPISNNPNRAVLTDETSFEHVDRDEQSKQETESKDKCDVYVKWETSKEELVQVFKISKCASLTYLRKMIEAHVGKKKKDFIFLMLGEQVSREKEASIQVTSLSLPDWQNQCIIACLRLPSPLNSLENILPPIQQPHTNSPVKTKTCASLYY